MNVLRSLTISVASSIKIFNFLAISTKSIFLSKNPYNLIKITRFWTFREVLFFQSSFTASLLGSAIFWKRSFFFEKPTTFCIKKHKFRTFSEFLLLQSPSTGIMLPLLFFLSKTVFSKNPIFCSKKRKFLNF